jgi:hypothetical protein
MAADLEAADAALKSFYRGRSLDRKDGRLRVRDRHGNDRPAILSYNGDGIQHSRGLNTGHTGAVAIGQLVRRVRGLTRVPVAVWRDWATDTIKLCGPETIRLLEASTYPDPNKTCCVLCGSERIGDWWSDREAEVVGPVCSMPSGCWQRRPGPETDSRLPRGTRRCGPTA